MTKTKTKEVNTKRYDESRDIQQTQQITREKKKIQNVYKKTRKTDKIKTK